MPIPERSKSSRGMRHTGGLKKVLDLEVPNREGPAAAIRLHQQAGQKTAPDHLHSRSTKPLPAGSVQI